MDKNVIFLICLIFIVGIANGQSSISDSLAYKYKLDYDVPESPAFSILDANPSKIMRGSSAKEFALSVANNFISNNKQEAGIAADFNPYFVFGGRMENVREYRESYLKRILANTQFSFASIRTDEFPNDNLFSGGIRITLIDAFDLLQDSLLGQDIDAALVPNGDPIPPQADSTFNDELIELEELGQAYQRAKDRVKLKRGWALSLGAATAQRALNGKLSADSLFSYRDQIWLSGQYSFGKGLNVMGLCMWRNTAISSGNTDEVLFGVGVRYIGKRANFGGEVIYSDQKDNLEIGANIEALIAKGVLLCVSIGTGSPDFSEDSNRIFVKPTFKYNISE